MKPTIAEGEYQQQQGAAHDQVPERAHALLHFEEALVHGLQRHDPPSCRMRSTQGADAVAKPGGALELQLLGRFAHLALQLAHDLFQLARIIAVHAQFLGGPGELGLFRLGQLARHLKALAEGLADGLRSDAVLDVVFELALAASSGFIHGLAHGRRDLVRIHDHAAFQVARGPAEGLDERARRTQKAFLVRVQNGHQGDFRQVQPLAQQVDATSTSNSPARSARRMAMRSMVSMSECR